MEKLLTPEQAYEVMLIFTKQYYYRVGEPPDLGRFLGDIQLLKPKVSADPASWHDWLAIVNKISKFAD